MPVLKDVECTRCGNRVELMLDGDTTEIVARCASPDCRKMTRHKTICTGGLKSRWRYADHTYDTLRERFSVKGVEAYDQDENGNRRPVTDINTGEDITAKVNEMNAAARPERKDRIHHHCERRRGRLPLHFDQKSKHAHVGG